MEESPKAILAKAILAKAILAKAILECPECGLRQKVEMPTDACQFFYECVNCKVVIKPKEGDCCVFCSYSDTLCPSKQLEKS